jgi:hypothetical protein
MNGRKHVSLDLVGRGERVRDRDPCRRDARHPAPAAIATDAPSAPVIDQSGTLGTGAENVDCPRHRPAPTDLVTAAARHDVDRYRGGGAALASDFSLALACLVLKTSGLTSIHICMLSGPHQHRDCWTQSDLPDLWT